MSEVDYEALDPGIRATVRRLRDAGFDTRDSGDGVTKLASGWDRGEVLNVPHVVCVSAPADLVAEARRLCSWLNERGVNVGALAPDGSGVSIQASFDPADGSAVIMLSGLADSGWTTGTAAA